MPDAGAAACALSKYHGILCMIFRSHCLNTFLLREVSAYNTLSFITLKYALLLSPDYQVNIIIGDTVLSVVKFAIFLIIKML